MKFRTLALACALGLVLGLGSTSMAADVPPDVDAATLKTAQERFERGFDTADIDYKLQALKKYAKVQHPKIAKHLITLLKDESKHVRAEAARGLGFQLTSVRKAGRALDKVLQAEDEEPKVLRQAVTAVGLLDYTKAEESLIPLIASEDDGVVAAVFGVFGRWKSDEAMTEMKDFFDTYPDEQNFATSAVRVDTGSAGNKDQKAAKRKFQSKFGDLQKWRPRPECTKALVAALKEITGFGFRRPEDLESWMTKPKKYVDPETIVERMDEADRKAAYVEWHRIKGEAEAEAAKEMPGDDEGNARAKLYGKLLQEKRAVVLEKAKLGVSEFDVIVEEGDAAKWPKQ